MAVSLDGVNRRVVWVGGSVAWSVLGLDEAE
jgi:hypothetical protein